MQAIKDAPLSAAGAERLFATFYVGDTLFGLGLDQIEEINRQLEITPVPQAPACVRGVINLRGRVVTVLDLRTVLGLPIAELNKQSRNVIVRCGGESVGLVVDRVADVVAAPAEQMSPPPANLSGLDGRFFTAVCRLANQLLVILDLESLLAD